MISAVILAAGQSRRMGQPKMLLPWGERTVIGQVITVFLRAGVEDVTVVTGAAREQVEQAIQSFPVRQVYNSEYQHGEMLSSLLLGLKTLPKDVDGTFIALGDQPQIQESTVRLLCQRYESRRSSLIVPSYQYRRGHPWLVTRPLWSELLALQAPQSPRDFLNQHAGEIDYVDIGTASVLADLDTPADYRNSHP
jgi:molybdenum cofactor cytidylyltransferase